MKHDRTFFQGSVKGPFSFASGFAALLLAALLAGLGLGAFAAPAQAADIPGAVTAVTVTPQNPTQYDPIKVSVDWAVPDGSKAGDTFSLQLPPELVALTTAFELKNPEGQLVARAQVNNGVVVFTLTDFAETHLKVKGTASFETQLTQEVTPGQPITLDFGVAGSTTIVPGAGNPVAQDKPRKYGYWIDAAGNGSAAPTDRIRWTILSPIGPYDQVRFEDTQGAGQQIDCASLAAQVSTSFNSRGEVSNWAALPAGSLTVAACGTQSFTATIQPVPAGKIVSVSYISAVTDAGLAAYTNSAEVTVNGTSLPTVSDLRRYASGGNGDGEQVTPPTTSVPTTSAPSSTPAPSTAPATSSAPVPSGGSTTSVPGGPSSSATSTTSTSSAPAAAPASPPTAVEGELANTGAGGMLPLLGAAVLVVVAGVTMLLVRRRAH